MSDLILHHYLPTTCSEKVWLVCGLKTVADREVITPPAMPKPISCLDGRLPTRIGADVCCDIRLILRKLEALYPEQASVIAEANSPDAGLNSFERSLPLG